MKKPTIITIISMTVIAILLMVGFWKWKSAKNIARQQAQNQEQQQVNNQQSQQISEDQLVWYEIPELGVRFKIPNDISEELVYYYDPKISAVYMSTKKLVNIDGTCFKDGPLGAFSRINKTKKNQNLSDRYGGIQKEFNDFVIRYSGSQSPCLLNSRMYEEFEQPIRAEFSNYLRSDEFFQSIEIIK